MLGSSGGEIQTADPLPCCRVERGACLNRGRSLSTSAPASPNIMSFCQTLLFWFSCYLGKKKKKHSLKGRGTIFHLTLDFPDNNGFIKQIEKAPAHNAIICRFRFLCLETGAPSRQAWRVRAGPSLNVSSPNLKQRATAGRYRARQALPDVGAGAAQGTAGRRHVSCVEPHPFSFPCQLVNRLCMLSVLCALPAASGASAPQIPHWPQHRGATSQ